MEHVVLVTNGAAAGARFTFSGRAARVGKSPQCEMTVEDVELPDHALTLMNRDGKLLVFPTGAVDIRVGDAAVSPTGTEWRPEDLVTAGTCQFRLLEADAAAVPIAETPRVQTERGAPKDEPDVEPSDAKAGNDMMQYVIIAVLMIGAIGIVLMPTPPSDSSVAPKKPVHELIHDLRQVEPELPSAKPTLAQIEDEMVKGYRNEANTVIAQRHYTAALQMLMMRANDLGSEDAPNDAAFRFETPLEYDLYDGLRAKLSSTAKEE